MEHKTFLDFLTTYGVQSFNSYDGLFRFESKVNANDLAERTQKEFYKFSDDESLKNEMLNIAYGFYQVFFHSLERYVRDNRFSKISYDYELKELKGYIIEDLEKIDALKYFDDLEVRLLNKAA